MSGNNKEKRIGIEEAVWKHCHIHNVDYPANAECPKCSRAKEK
jgi:hypothetical protein